MKMRVTDEALRAFGAFVEVNLKSALARAQDEQPARYEVPRVLADVPIDDTQARLLAKMMMIDADAVDADEGDRQWLLDMELDWLGRVSHVSSLLQSMATAVWCCTNAAHLPVTAARVHLNLARDHLCALMNALDDFALYFDDTNWINIEKFAPQIHRHLNAIEDGWTRRSNDDTD